MTRQKMCTNKIFFFLNIFLPPAHVPLCFYFVFMLLSRVFMSIALIRRCRLYISEPNGFYTFPTRSHKIKWWGIVVCMRLLQQLHKVGVRRQSRLEDPSPESGCHHLLVNLNATVSWTGEASELETDFSFTWINFKCRPASGPDWQGK